MKRIVIENVSKKFKIGFNKDEGALGRFISLFSGTEPKKVIYAIKDASFGVEGGEIVGIIGNNGSGKSTLLRMIAGIHESDDGRIITNGKTISLINLQAGLKERLTMKDNIFLCCSLFGLSQKETAEKLKSIIEFSELGDFLNTKVYQFSEGMKQRISFSIAIHCNPQILLLDEVFEIGDESFKTKSSQKIKDLAEKGASVIVVSHDMDMIKRHCNRVVELQHGRILNNLYFEDN